MKVFNIVSYIRYICQHHRDFHRRLHQNSHTDGIIKITSIK